MMNNNHYQPPCDSEEGHSGVIHTERFESWYIVGELLQEETLGCVYAGVRKADEKMVAIKYVNKCDINTYVITSGEGVCLPLEVALMQMASRPPFYKNVVKLLDWFDLGSCFVWVMERPSPCIDLHEFCRLNNGRLPESVAQDIMWQLVFTVWHCCDRKVFHRDIKPENVLINTETMQVTLIDFGCGDFMTDKPYTTNPGTPAYWPPEFLQFREYMGRPATVWSLGVLMYLLICGDFPFKNLEEIANADLLVPDDLSRDCQDLLSWCLRKDPYYRATLEDIINHKWLMVDKLWVSVRNYSDLYNHAPVDELQQFHPSPLQLKNTAEGGANVSCDEPQPNHTCRKWKRTHTEDNDPETERDRRSLKRKKTEETAQETERNVNPVKKAKRQKKTETQSCRRVTPFRSANISRLYEVGKVLGEGTYGVVYAGVRKSDGKKVALKFMAKSPNDQYITLPGDTRRLPIEVALMELACKPPHCPYVIQLLEWFETAKYVILILERPDPVVDLYTYIRQVKINETQARVIMAQVVQAAIHCHDRGVFHRDIKEENILLNPNTLDVKLIDFGCGYLLQDTPYEGYAGTESFTPPESVLLEEYMAEPTTTWGLGVLLYSLLCRKTPFRGLREIALCDPDIPDYLSEDSVCLITWCLKREPEDRPTLKQILKHDWFLD